VKANLIAVLNWSSKYGVKLNPSYSEVDIPNYIPSKISHSARRSFATINTLRNIPRNKILRATGHSSEKAFNRYICYDEEN
jgi:hypothetical protein